jgi:hypothetical protein
MMIVRCLAIPMIASLAIVHHFDEVHAFENTGTQPLELLIVGIARDMRKQTETNGAQPCR